MVKDALRSKVLECENLLATQRVFKPPSGRLGAKPTADLNSSSPLPSTRPRRVLLLRFDNLTQRLMSAVDAGAIHSDRHLFAHGPAQPEEPPTVSPNEVVISSSYSPGTIHASVLDEDAALHHDKDFEPLDLSHDPSIQPGESTAGSIRVLDDVPDHIGVTAEDMTSGDDGQDWTEGESQEHKRVKVRLPSASIPIPHHVSGFRAISSRFFFPSYRLFLCSVFATPRNFWIHSLTQLQGLRACRLSLGRPRHRVLLRALRRVNQRSSTNRAFRN